MKIGRYVLIAIAVILAVFFWVRLTRVDYMKKSLEIESVINQKLLEMGLSEKDLLETYNEERTLGKTKWIYFTRKFRVSRDFSFEKCKKLIEDGIRTKGGKVISSKINSDGKRLTLTIGIRNVVTHLLIFERTTALARIAIIIDDIGFDLPSVREILTIDAPIAFAVLPHAPYSITAAEILHGAGREILLHLPMEPHDPGKNPGPGALFCWMGEAEIRQQVEEDLAAVPHVIGVNNHMGSAFMEDEGKLAVVFGELKKRGLFFIDSRTTPHSKAGDLALKMGIPSAARKVFIDNDQDHEITVKSLLGHLEKNSGNRMVMIGHPYPSTVLALKYAVPILKARGVAIVPPSEMVEIIDGAETNNKKD